MCRYVRSSSMSQSLSNDLDPQTNHEKPLAPTPLLDVKPPLSPLQSYWLPSAWLSGGFSNNSYFWSGVKHSHFHATTTTPITARYLKKNEWTHDRSDGICLWWGSLASHWSLGNALFTILATKTMLQYVRDCLGAARYNLALSVKTKDHFFTTFKCVFQSSQNQFFSMWPGIGL